MGRPPIGDRAMSAAERKRRQRANQEYRDKATVTKPAAPQVEVVRLRAAFAALERRHAALEQDNAALKRRNSILEGELAAAQKGASASKDESAPSAPHQMDEKAWNDSNRGKRAMDEKAYKLVRQLNLTQDNLVLKAARTLARTYDMRPLAKKLETTPELRCWSILRALDSDVDNNVLNAARGLARTYDLLGLATTLEGSSKTVREARQRDQAKVEPTVAAYVKGKTKVTFANVWSAVLRAAPSVNDMHAPAGTPDRIHDYLGAHGFTCNWPRGTYIRPSA